VWERSQSRNFHQQRFGGKNHFAETGWPLFTVSKPNCGVVSPKKPGLKVGDSHLVGGLGRGTATWGRAQHPWGGAPAFLA